jgi:hypothetical protein
MAKFISVEVDVDFSRVIAQTKSQAKQLAELPEQALNEFVKNTPVRSGRARRSTRLTRNIIRADYPYAGRLDDGYSQQSPRGMTKPTEEFITKRFKQIFGK